MRTQDQARTVDRSRWVRVVGTRRRLRALARMGWPVSQVADRAGLPTPWLVQVISGQVQIGPVSAVDAVTGVYDTLWRQAGPSRAVAAAAAARRWAGPLAWDDDTIDLPQSRPSVGERVSRTPDPLAVDLLLARQYHDPAGAHILDRVAACLVLLSTRRHLADTVIADWVGVSTRTVARYRRASAPAGNVGVR